MALKHAKSGEMINLATLIKDKSIALVKHKRFEVMRISLSTGQSMAPHKVPGPITVQCLEGKCIFSMDDISHELAAGFWLYLEGGAIHAVEAVEETHLLVTILFNEKSAP